MSTNHSTVAKIKEHLSEKLRERDGYLINHHLKETGVNSTTETLIFSIEIGSSNIFLKIAEINFSTFSETILEFFPGSRQNEYEKIISCLQTFKDS